jgi:DNA replication regulator DPB11
MNLAPGFSRRSTHLLCPSMVGAKFEKAREWGIPVVSLKWLEEVARSGMIPAVDVFPDAHRGSQRMDAITEMDVDMDLYVVGTDGKGKGRAIDKGKAREDEQMDERMNDGMEGDLSCLTSFQPDRFFAVQMVTSTQQRTPLTQGRDMSLQLDLSFGETNGILDCPQSTQLPAQRPSFSKRVGRITRTGPPPPPPLATSQNSSTETDTSNTLDPEPRKPTPLEIERERKQARIPSSKSPSPMKIPAAAVTPKRKGPRTLSVSPTKLTREASKALKDNITSLLGKRQPSVGDEDAMNLRAGKRPRPKVGFKCDVMRILLIEIGL